jgi:hypothetical protein
MRLNKSDKDPLLLEVEFCHQPVGIAFDVENNPAVL